MHNPESREKEPKESTEMRINKESCRQALEVMLGTYTVWNDASEKASLLPVIAVLAIGAGQDGLDVPIDDDAWDEQISLTPEGEAALLADVVEGSGLPAPFDGPEWAGWRGDDLYMGIAVRRDTTDSKDVVVAFLVEKGFQVLGWGGRYTICTSQEIARSKAEELARAAGGWA